MNEKQPLTVPDDHFRQNQRPKSSRPRNARYFAIGAGISYLLLKTLILLSVWDPASRWGGLVRHEETQCPHQPQPLHPRLEWDPSDQDKEDAVSHFSQAVQIPTQSFDDNGEPADDPRWAPFRVFQDWLKDTYPQAWSTANVEFINELGVLATFEGSDTSLKPLILMSHYDVVPAPNSTADRWTHGPFSGYNDGTYIWGRGAADDKALLVAQWESISHLLEAGFKPRRTLILSHGFDEEEVFARRGQGTIAPYLEKRYGNNGILMVIDEGSGTSDDFYGAPFALPNMGEKGYLDIKIAVRTTGGHSSVPPKHTGIGIMSNIVSALEDNPFENKLTSASPYLTTLQCAAKHSSSFPKSLAALLKLEGPRSWPRLAKKLARQSNFERAMLGTTTAVDVVKGGVKVNALPEVVESLVNFRIDFDESVHSAQKHIEKLLHRVAKKHDLPFHDFASSSNGTGMGVFVELVGEPLEPAPRTPSSGPVWELFAGTVKAAIPGPDGKDRVVAPYVSTGNTDCKMYYDLSKNIYRFAASPSEGSFGVHTVDERSSIEGFYQIINWVHAIIQNTDAYSGPE